MMMIMITVIIIFIIIIIITIIINVMLINIRFSPAKALHLRVPDVGVPQIKNLNVVETKSCCKGGVRKAFSNPSIVKIFLWQQRWGFGVMTMKE